MTLTEKEFRFLQRNLNTFMHACEYAIEDSRFDEDYEWLRGGIVWFSCV